MVGESGGIFGGVKGKPGAGQSGGGKSEQRMVNLGVNPAVVKVNPGVVNSGMANPGVNRRIQLGGGVERRSMSVDPER